MKVDDHVIAVDLDGTVCTINEDYSRCELIPGTLEGLKRLKEKGFRIYICTGRHINQYEPTIAWLVAHKVPYDHIIFGKPPAKYYIDDRAIPFTSWDDVLEKIGV